MDEDTIPEIIVKNPGGEFIRFDGQTPSCNANRETLRPLPPDLGQGRFYSLSCRPGMDICMSHCRFIRDYQARITRATPRISFAFCVSGATRTQNPDKTTCCELYSGQADIFYFEQPVLERLTAGGRDLKAVVIHFSPGFLAQLVSPGQAPEDALALARSLADGSRFSTRKMDFSMQSIVFQMFACPHQGAVRQIYLESKAMELAALTLSQAFEPGIITRVVPVRADEQQRIMDARDILVSRLQYPPSLNDLAGMVGISHARLNRGFKKMFGFTVFEYLRRERLEYARMLIATHRMSITQAAFEAGFSGSSHFARAFYKRYGIQPSAYRTGCGVHPVKQISGAHPQTDQGKAST